LPIKTKTEVVGVLQLINKAGGAFDFHDEELLEGFLAIVAGVISSSQLFQLSRKHEKEGDEFSDKLASPVQTEDLKKKFSSLGTFAEQEDGDEEGEEDDF